jgi:hypothetical protein
MLAFFAAQPKSVLVARPPHGGNAIALRFAAVTPRARERGRSWDTAHPTPAAARRYRHVTARAA